MSPSSASSSGEVPRVVIIGGGIAGLAAAWELEPESRAGTLAVEVLEASARLGGPIRSDLGSGHVLEGGADCFLTTKPGALELCRELGLAGSVIGVRPSARRAYIYRGGHLHRIPAVIGPDWWASARSVLASPLLSRAGKLRTILGAAWIRSRPIRVDDHTPLGPQLRSRFGDEVVDWLLEPFLAGVHPAPLDTLSASAVASVLPSRWTTGRPGLPERSASAPSRSPPPEDRGRVPVGVFASLQEGMEQLPRTLAEHLRGATVHLGQSVREVRRGKGRYEVVSADGPTVLADGLILAVQPPAAARLLQREFPAASSLLEQVRMESLVVVAAVFDRSEVPVPLDGSGVLVPRSSGLSTSAVTWLSEKWDRGEPERGEVALRVFLRLDPGRTTLPTEEECVALARQGVREVMGITARPHYTAVFPHRAALAWYEVGHVDRIREVRRILGPGSAIELAGSSYDGIGIPDAIRSGRDAARRVRGRTDGGRIGSLRDDLSRPTVPVVASEGAGPISVGSPG